jgi:Tol biopolymer transport system component
LPQCAAGPYQPGKEAGRKNQARKPKNRFDPYFPYYHRMKNSRHLVAPLWLVTVTLAMAGCASPSGVTVPVTSGTHFAVTGNDDALYFDLQGLVWRLPPDGGEAVALTDAGDDVRNVQLSPDGQWLTAQSFAAGAWDIIVMRTDGRERRKLTNGRHDDREPAWSDNGRSILFTSDRAGSEDIWSVDIKTGALMQLTTDSAADYAPAPLGDEVLFVSDRGGKPGLYGFKHGNGVRPFLSGKGNKGLTPFPPHAPRVSPDGKSVAFVQTIRRNGFPGVAMNELAVLDLDSGESRTLSAPDSDVFARPPAWLDADTLLATIDGGIWRIALEHQSGTGKTTAVPFTAPLPLTRTSFTPNTPLAFSPAAQPMLGIVDPILLPDNALVFTALGDLWRLGHDGILKALSDDAFVERDVTVSPNGSTLAFISDRPADHPDAKPGDNPNTMQIWLLDLATGSFKPLTTRSHGPRYPTFSPDGTMLAWLEVGPRGTQDFTVRVLDLAAAPANKKPRKLRSSPKIWPGRLSFSADGTHLTVAELFRPSARSGDGRNRLVRIDLATDTATPLELPGDVTPDFGPVASPDGRQLALIIDGALWFMPVTRDGRPDGVPIKVLDELIESPTFSSDGQQLVVLTNRGLEVIDLNTKKRSVRNPAHTWQPAKGDGRQLIHAGRLWDGVRDDYLTEVDIIIDGTRIVSVQPHTTHPQNIPVIDASDRTVLPGLIDHHVHFEPHKGEWLGRGLLAFGVTTVVEPGGLPYESREHFESWRSGRRAGPRLVFAGPQLDGARRTFHFGAHINNEQRLQWELERGDRLGYGLLKTYRRMRPELQARTVELGHARGLPVTAHAALRNLGFGGDRTEHLRGGARVIGSSKQSDALVSYDDVLAIFTTPPTTSITPTLVGKGGFFDATLRFPALTELPQYTTLYSPAYRKNLAGFTKFVARNIDLIRTGLDHAGATLQALDAHGVTIVAGTDSPIFPYGLALVIELQGYVDAGLTPAAALHTATSNAARAMGAADEIGRIKAGLLADLIIVDGDPLAQITDLAHVTGIMLNGQYQTIESLLGSN